MANIVALLDSMWSWGGDKVYVEAHQEAPRYFRINSENHSGRRLYRLCGDNSLLVTNSCRYVQPHANSHGKPDPEWVRENLIFLRKEGMNLLLVCGKVAKETFESIRFNRYPPLRKMPVLFIDHPAARRWTNEKVESTRMEIENLCLAFNP